MTAPASTALPDGRVHLVGVGGAGMSGLARILLQRGHPVSGTDLKDSRELEVLQALGARVRVGHHLEALGDADLVVRSAAVPDDNPELVAARERGVPVWPRARLLAALMEGDRRVLVTGTHGKTTTTSMVVVALQAAGADPSFSVGGQLNEVGSNAHAGHDPLFVAEADESDRSFLLLTPDLAVVTNIEHDHPAEFEDDVEVREAFAAFLGRRTPEAPAVVCLDDPGVRLLLRDVDPPGIVTYGRRPEADHQVVPRGPGEASLRLGGSADLPYRLVVPGEHNLLNAAAALLTCHLLGTDLEAAAGGLARFTGAARRFQLLGEADGVTVVDDYAHHPTEVRATLAAARGRHDGRVVLVVQPHRYTRTAALGEELGRATAGADLVVVTDVYGSGEQPIPGVSGRIVAEAAERAGAVVVWEPHLGSVAERLAEEVRPGDLVLVTGAGDVTQVGPSLLETLRSGRG